MSTEPNHESTTFPAVPPSLSAGDHEMREHYVKQEAQRPTPNTVQDITPYLGLRSRLSQVWINRWTVLLFLVLVRILIAIAGLNHDLSSAKTEAMSACNGVESMGSAMASMPHYLAAGVNELAAAGVEKAVHGLMSLLLMVITGVEEIFLFWIHMLTQTYECLIYLVVSGSIEIATGLLNDANQVLNKTLQGISDGLNTAISGTENDINKFTNVLNGIPKAFGSDKGGDIPKLDYSATFTALHNVQLPQNWTSDLNKLNASIPSFSQVENFTDSIIKFPFEEVKKLINGSLVYNFNRSLLPVPQKEALTFCSDNNGIENFFEDLADIANLARRIFIAVLVIIAVLICIPMAIQEIRRWRTMKQRAQLVGDKSFDPMDVIYIASRPYTAAAGIKAASSFKSTKRQVLTRWVIAYATTTPALVVLSLGVTGLLACLCQYILLRLIVKEVPELANEVGNFADKVMSTLNNASEAWANGTNDAIMGTNNEINHNVLGWVNTTSGAVNGTLNAFLDETTKLINGVFGNTVLDAPVQTLFECLVGLKINAIEKGLTWVSDNAQVDFPLLPNNTFSLGAAASLADSTPNGATQSFLASPGSEAADKITNAVVKVTNHIANAIRTEAIISSCVLLLWVMVVLMGIARALYMGFKRDKHRAEGGPAVTDGIAMEEPIRPYSSVHGPAPAYEPPRENFTSSARPFPNFSEPMSQDRHPGRNPPTNEDQWQDEKLGFAGRREPATEESGLDARRSVYPTVEKS